LLIAGEHDYEIVTFNFHNPELDAVSWEIFSSTLPSTDAGLLNRVDSKAELLKKEGALGDVVRRGQIQMGGTKAEELLEKAKIYNMPSQLFTAESLPPRPAFPTPTIQLSLETGGLTSPNDSAAKPSPWSTEEAVGVWDAVVKSARLRQGAI
jgi:Tle cognate immunity protein 4 C-terminal domain